MCRIFKDIFKSNSRSDFLLSKSVLIETEEKFSNPYDVTVNFKGYGIYEKIAPKQAPEEINGLMEIYKELNPKNICEIGTYRGGTFYIWCKLANENSNLISIDLPSKSNKYYTPERIDFYKLFGKPKQRLHFLPADSQSPETSRKVREILNGEQLDFLFIDGDHRYEGVKRDFENYFDLVCDGGIIAFHDILPRQDAKDIQVDKFWNEIKSQFKYIEIIGPSYKQTVGIGVIWK